MSSGQPSRTSMMVAAARAIGARDPDPSVRNPDYLAEKFMGPEVRALKIDHPAIQALDWTYDDALKNAEVMGSVVMMLIRTRYIDERLQNAVRNGAEQVVVLGAGFDSRAYRFTDLLTDVRVFEVDRPVTQVMKKRRVMEVLGSVPANLTYVPIDFQHENLGDVLQAAGFQSGRKTFFIWEGVTMYLAEEAARDTLSFVGAQAPGSSIVFDYVHDVAIQFLKNVQVDQLADAMKAPVQRLLNLMAREPWIFGMPREREKEFLAELGLDVTDTMQIGGEESVKRYLTRADGSTFWARPATNAPQRAFYFLMEAGVPAS